MAIAFLSGIFMVIFNPGIFCAGDFLSQSDFEMKWPALSTEFCWKTGEVSANGVDIFILSGYDFRALTLAKPTFQKRSGNRWQFIRKKF